eukprot:gnl/MRDRNA2_/MRDRNA2_28954_c0_seq1.p1 gnl/MRDRNA2_/MRDRNA2_28954_c0~~gnl/MRDRNA2_/MRDRNA2_28954_c0_seq1.p1  ORF type:complete len:188 (+),score=23.27 gnl/MRDRNA2_/MRDRNA2_28954_c0_seq1:105-668(+)
MCLSLTLVVLVATASLGRAQKTPLAYRCDFSNKPSLSVFLMDSCEAADKGCYQSYADNHGKGWETCSVMWRYEMSKWDLRSCFGSCAATSASLQWHCTKDGGLSFSTGSGCSQQLVAFSKQEYDTLRSGSCVVQVPRAFKIFNVDALSFPECEVVADEAQAVFEADTSSYSRCMLPCLLVIILQLLR